jgi:hypothetical protein
VRNLGGGRKPPERALPLAREELILRQECACDLGRGLRIISVRLASALFAIFMVLLSGARQPARVEQNLLLNPDFKAGNSMPENWCVYPPDRCESFEWLHPKQEPGELRVAHAVGDSTGWVQFLELTPGWYYLSADLKTAGMARAFLAISAGNARALSEWATTNWQREGFYLRVKISGDVQVRCGLIAVDNSAGASFRDASLIKISGNPPAGTHQVVLDSPPLRSRSARIDHWIRICIAALLAILSGVFLWFRDGTPLLKTTKSLAQLEVPTSRSSPQETSIVSNPVPSDAWRTIVVGLTFGLLLLITLALTRISWSPSAGLSVVSPEAANSDEPHYILSINSLLFEHELEVQDEYERVALGGPQAGVLFAHRYLDHHSILVDGRTGRHAFASIVAPNSVAPCDPAFGSPDVYEVPSHPVAFPAMMTLILAPFHPELGDVEGDASVILGIISWLTALVTFLAGRSLGMKLGRAMLAALLLIVASPWLPYARSFFPSSTIGLALILALWAFIEERVVLTGLAASFAAVLSPPFAVVGVGFMLEEIRAGHRRNALTLLIVLGSCAAALVAFNYWLAMTPLISGNGGLSAFSIDNLYETFLGSEHGLFFFAPWTILVFLAVGCDFRATRTWSRSIHSIVIPVLLFTILMGCGAPGLSYGPRYWVPFLPWFALVAIELIGRARRPALIACGLLALLSALIAIPGALRYPQLFSEPPWAAWE